MDLLNIVGGICSILGLLFSIWTTIRTGKISKTVNTSLAKERFRLNYDNIMHNLKSYTFIALREDFEISNEFLFEFRTELYSFEKSYRNILSNDEVKALKDSIQLLSPENFNQADFSLTISKIISKPKYNQED